MTEKGCKGRGYNSLLQHRVFFNTYIYKNKFSSFKLFSCPGLAVPGYPQRGGCRQRTKTGWVGAIPHFLKRTPTILRPKGNPCAETSSISTGGESKPLSDSPPAPGANLLEHLYHGCRRFFLLAIPAFRLCHPRAPMKISQWCHWE